MSGLSCSAGREMSGTFNATLIARAHVTHPKIITDAVDWNEGLNVKVISTFSLLWTSLALVLSTQVDDSFVGLQL